MSIVFRQNSISEYSREYDSSIFGVFTKRVMIDDCGFCVNLKDTNKFTVDDIKYNTLWSDAIVLVYSDSDISSLRSVPHMSPEFLINLIILLL